jgi:acetyltransferase-like isoleucine patch superfamily enzyme
MDRVTGMVLDEATDTLYVTTDRTFSVSQHSVWAINTVTGSLRWSTNANQIFVPPVLRNGRLYVATLFGEIKALDASSGIEIWSYSNDNTPNGPGPFVANLAIGVLPPDDTVLAAADFFDTIWTVRDSGISPSLEWNAVLPPGGSADSNQLAIDSLTGTLYAGAIDGNLYEYDVSSGKLRSSYTIDASEGSVGPLTLSRTFLTSGNELQIFAGSANGTVAKLCKGIVPIENEVNLSFSNDTASEAEGTEIIVMVNSSSIPAAFQTVDIEVTGKGITGEDYALPDGKTVPLIPGTLNEFWLRFRVLDDAVDEGVSETAVISLVNLSAGLVPGDVPSQTVTIFDNDFDDVDIGDGAIIGNGTQLNKGVSIGNDAELEDNVVVNKNTTAGDNLFVGSGTTIDEDTVLGDDVYIGANVSIGKNCMIGNGVIIGDNTMIGPRCVIGDNVNIGANVTIGKDVTVLAGTVIPDGTVVPAKLTVPPLP